jgi:tRNA(Glu) U13 pseudouridine synthase TruD
MLHVNQKVFSMAGTKDKRGVTVQQVPARQNNITMDCPVSD